MKTILKKFAVTAVMTLAMSMVLTACSKDEPDYDYDDWSAADFPFAFYFISAFDGADR